MRLVQTIPRLLGAYLLSGAIALAAPPPGMTPSPVMEAWFKSLRQPGTQMPCCSISDCRFTQYQIRGGRFEVTIDDWPYTVPDQVVLQLKDKPTGRAVVCYTYKSFDPPTPVGEIPNGPQDKIEILCFVPSTPSS